MKNYLKLSSVVLAGAFFMTSFSMKVGAKALKNGHNVISKTAVSVQSDSQYYEHEDNGSFDLANNVGYWQYKFMQGTLSDENDEDYFKFYASKGDRIAINLKGLSTEGIYQLTLFDQYKNEIDTATNENERNPKQNAGNTMIRFDVPSSGNYYVKISFLGGMLDPNDIYTLDFFARYKTVFTTIPLTPYSISSPGSGETSPNATANLQNNSSIPKDAIVTRISVKGNFSPYLGNTYLQLTDPNGGVHSSRVALTNLNQYINDIHAENQMPLRGTWSVNYYSDAWSTSRMSNLSLNVEYEYDSTLSK